MKTRVVLLFCFALSVAACSSRRHMNDSIANNPGNDKNSSKRSVPKDTNDGLTYETAIVITEKSEGKGVDAEYAWIKDHYTAYTVKKQSLSTHNGKPFDIITITQSNGKDLPLYFDISNYFGKF